MKKSPCQCVLPLCQWRWWDVWAVLGYQSRSGISPCVLPAVGAPEWLSVFVSPPLAQNAPSWQRWRQTCHPGCSYLHLSFPWAANTASRYWSTTFQNLAQCLFLMRNLVLKAVAKYLCFHMAKWNEPDKTKQLQPLKTHLYPSSMEAGKHAFEICVEQGKTE